MTAVSSSAQNDFVPLQVLCKNTIATLEMLQLLFTLHPTALGENTTWLHVLCLTIAITMDALQVALCDVPTDVTKLNLSAKTEVQPGPRETRDVTTVSSTAQDGNTPLLLLCYNTSVTAEMIQALGALHPAAAGEKDKVRAAAHATRAI